MAATTTASLLLLAMGLLGASDIALFHQRAHRLHARPEAAAELVTHALRGPRAGWCARDGAGELATVLELGLVAAPLPRLRRTGGAR